MVGQQPMIPTSDDSGFQKTSLTMTRAMADDIGLKVKKILEDIDNKTINQSYTDWQWFISECWSDDIWIMAMNKAIIKCKEIKLDLNCCKNFLDIIQEMSPTELKNEFKKTHPIARLSLMDIVNKKQPKPKPERLYEDLWLTPKELRDKHKDRV